MDYHIRKVLKIYRERRDLFCMLLKGELSDFFEFNTPKGGMAVWTKLNLNYSWDTIFKIARRHKLEIGDWQQYDLAKSGHNYIRIGFAAYSSQEIHELIEENI
jgi:GntR family transcriptional regulator/MocR family aminotransferase